MDRPVFHIFFHIFFLLFFVSTGFAQCIVVDSATTYSQDFETSDGNWIPGGTLSDWEWGHPAKSIITGAAGGQNCWITGGLSGSAYNATQRSYIVSPCFDFTNLQYPYIEFKVFWETEYRYDGNAFQYSLNNGSTWLNVGAVNEPQNCLNNNWFNYSSISNMTGLGPNKEGWSGTTLPSAGPCSGGNGSGAWIRASHTLSFLAGKANVIFRFTCGAGTTCNDYDGFAIDDIKISNAPPNSVDFLPNCIADNTVAFNNLSSPCFTTYSWDFGDPASGSANTVQSFNPTHTFSGPGSYMVVLTASGATGPALSVAKQVHIMDVKAAITKAITCGGAGNGEATATLNADAGVTGVAYNWNTTPPATTPVVTGLSPGTYIVTVTAANACTTSDTVNVVSPQPLTHKVSQTNVTCGNTNGFISIAESGGVQPYSFTWSPNVSNASSAANLSPGNYVVSITDNANCSDSVHVQIVNLAPPLQHSVVINNITCTNTIASASINETGGTPSYSFVWSPSGGNGASATGLAIGNYVIRILDQSGCLDTVHISIVNTSTVSVVVKNVINVSCNGGNNGSATAMPAGVSPFTFAWSSLGGNLAMAMNLPAGNYTVTATDATGCKGNASVQITQPLAINSIIIKTPTTCNLNNGSATASSISGGTAPYTYSWMPGNMTGATVTNLAPGTYTLAITDAKGCTATQKAVINSSASTVIDTVIITDAKCYATQSGVANAVVSGGVAPYSFSWTKGSNTFTGNPLQNAGAGTYQLAVADAKGCKATKSITIRQPLPLTHTINSTDATCNNANGTAAITEAGGNPPYTFVWPSPVIADSAAFALAEGNYAVRVSDVNHCIDSFYVSVLNRGGITAQLDTLINVKCFGGNNGSASIIVTPATTPVIYSWSNGAGNVSTANNLSKGNYLVRMTDTVGCTASVSFSITQPPLLSIALAATNANCNHSNGQVKATPSGGTPTYSYVWLPLNVSDAAITNLSAGQYSVTVTDQMGCKTSASVNIEMSCRDIVFPDAFSPDGNNINDAFGPLGTLSAVSDYTFRIFNRWGQPVFTSTDPFRKWNGKLNGAEASSGVYVWMAEYSFDHRPRQAVKGTVVLVK